MISEILTKYDTDKISHHRYGDVYDRVFSQFDREAPLNILEIGTQKGGSLLAWKEYFPNANVYGVDIVDVVTDEYRKDTVNRVISDIKDWKNNIEWDIVIDDGSHYFADVVYVVSQYCLRLKEKGALIIEDVRAPDLLMETINYLLMDIQVGFPKYKGGDVFQVTGYDMRSQSHDQSYILTMIKQ